MNLSEFSAKGGRAKSARKRAACLISLKKAWEARRRKSKERRSAKLQPEGGK
jgi:hypothetical protein